VTNTDIAVIDNVKSALTDDALHDITDFDSAMRVFADAGVIAESISDYGTGFTVVEKDRLVGVPFIIAEWRFNSGSYKDENGDSRQFVSAACVTKSGDKWVINDGGTGIAEQLATVTRRRLAKGHATPQNGLLVPAGLTVSHYEREDEKGIMQPAKTFYLSESPTPNL
jgi:hypothetical protein